MKECNILFDSELKTTVHKSQGAHMTGGNGPFGSWGLPDGRLGVEVFETLRHADGQQHQWELFLQGQG